MSETYSLADIRSMQSGSEGDTYSLRDVRAMSSGAAPSGVPGKSIPQRMLDNAVGPALFNALVPTLGTQEGRSQAWNTIVGGPLRAAAGIGSTLLYPIDKAQDLYYGDRSANGVNGRQPPSRNEERRASIDQFFQENFDPRSASFQGSKAATEIAATLGVGPAMGAAVKALPISSPVVSAFGDALASGGVRRVASGLGPFADFGIRTAGGAITGGASVGLVDPQSAGAGALIGGAMPLGIQAANAIGTGGAQLVRALRTPADVRAARDIAALAGADPKDLASVARVRDALSQHGPQIIPGQGTVPEILQNPEISQLQRTVAAVQPAPFAQRAADREAARRAVLENIAPIGQRAEVAQEVGNNIAEYAAAQNQAARAGVRARFAAIDPGNESRVILPVDEMQAARDRFLGPGTFGSGGSAQQAIDEARRISTLRAPAPAAEFSSSDLSRAGGRLGGAPSAGMPGQLEPVSLEELQSLRSSIGEQWRAATRAGNAKEAAALIQQQRAIDNTLEALANGGGRPGEYFPADMRARYADARAAHAAREEQFMTGPQYKLFRDGADGLRQIAGAEVPPQFFNGRPSQVADAQAFRRLVSDDPRLVNDLRRYAISDAAGQTDRLGNLSPAKFNRWLESRAGATGEIFTDQQRAWLRAIAEDLRRGALTEALGRSSGSDTMQKAASLTRLGLVDNPALRLAARKIPFAPQALDYLAGPARTARAEQLGNLLMDPQRTAGLLDVFIATRQPPVTPGLLGPAGAEALSRTAPLLLTSGQR